MRKTLGVCLFALLLSSSASGGIMQNGTPAPPPVNAVEEPKDAPEPTDETIADGVMQNDTPDSLTQTVLDLLALLPSLL
jgi:hypothetical protein